MYSGDETYGDEITSPAERMNEPTDTAFDAWLKKLDRIVRFRLGVTLDDLEDLDTYSAFEDDYTPREFYNEEIAPEYEEGE